MGTKILTLLTFLAVFFYGCNSKPELVQVIKDVDGPLRENLNVVSNEVRIELVKSVLGGLNQYQISFSVEMEVTKPSTIPGGYKDGSPFGPTLEYRFFDESKQPININGFRVQSDPDLDKIAYNLGIKGNKFWIRIFQGIDASSESVKLMTNLLDQTKFVQITSSVQGNVNSEQIVISDSSNVDCEQILKNYEQFMTKYIEIIKKYKENPTDATILTDYTMIVTENTKWGSQIEKCVSNSDYTAKFIEIQTKISTALSTLK
jgi:PBP1b-binding outer membrane lipoprotein LpoB